LVEIANYGVSLLTYVAMDDHTGYLEMSTKDALNEMIELFRGIGWWSGDENDGEIGHYTGPEIIE
jgi:hypothetical protein